MITAKEREQQTRMREYLRLGNMQKFNEYVVAEDITNWTASNLTVHHSILTSKQPMSIAALSSPTMKGWINKQDSLGRTALDCAIQAGRPDAAAALVKLGGRSNMPVQSLMRISMNAEQTGLTIEHLDKAKKLSQQLVDKAKKLSQQLENNGHTIQAWYEQQRGSKGRLNWRPKSGDRAGQISNLQAKVTAFIDEPSEKHLSDLQSYVEELQRATANTRVKSALNVVVANMLSVLNPEVQHDLDQETGQSLESF